MKKAAFLSVPLVLTLALASSASLSRAAIIFADNFEYAAGNLQTNSAGTWGLDGTPANGTNYIVKTLDWGTGNGVQTDPREGNIRATHSLNLSAYGDSTVYFSMQVDALPVPTAAPYNGSGGEGLRFVAMGIWQGTTERLYWGKASGTNANWGFYNYPGGQAFSATSSAGLPGPTELVVRIDFSSTGADSVKMYVLDPNNLPSTEPFTADVERTGGELGVIDQIRFATGWSAAGAAQPTSWAQYDNIGVFTSWSDLKTVNAPEPGSTLLLAGSLVGAALRRRRGSR